MKVVTHFFRENKEQQVSKDHVEMVVNKAKYELVKWIIGGVIANGIVAMLLKYLS